MDRESPRFAVMLYTNLGTFFSPCWRWITHTVEESIREAMATWLELHTGQWERKHIVVYHSREWENLVL